MRFLTEVTALDHFIGTYGPDWKPGILTEHIDLFEYAGGAIREGSSRAGWGVMPDGRAYPLVCSEVVWIDTEDGRIDGRCGTAANKDTGRCDYHDGR